ncbi:SPV015 kelch-like protein [Swinepox virus]|uniref:SPV015 kelch-like protein n=1 Tax=Swinepox virus (strain Swine/Nebraska/17077-99/1999) TaxID=300880 RepID=Q8V3S2_SWPV1|nr:kelch-like protein [Swinepox virus]AAL69754.1 SPV015 kelch-like protein [Swinepox virus]UED36561.1 kelch-like protein [Swinepox virus]UED36710.1 kelch-like protein [Swinepox virus]UUA44205.1 SPV015 [Swinepox virus]
MSKQETYIDYNYIERLNAVNLNRSYDEEIVFIMTVGGVVKVKKELLVSVSNYFKLITKNQSNEITVSFQYESFLDIIKYIETGIVTIDLDNVENIFSISCSKAIDFLKNSCIDFMSKHITDSTCVKIYKIGFSNGCFAVYNDAIAYIRKRFTKIETDILLSLSLFDLRIILKSGELDVSSEDDVLLFIIKWSRHKKSNRRKSFTLVTEVLRYNYLSIYGKYKLTKWLARFGKNNNVELNENELPRISYQHRFTNRRYTMVTPSSFSINMLGNVSVKNELSIINSIAENHNPYCGSVLMNDILYLIGGINKSLDPVSDITSVDTRSFIELHTPPLLHPRKCPGVAIFKNRIYVVGGIGYDGPLKTVESWSPGEQQWREEVPLLQPRFNPCIIGTDNDLYVVGGISEDDKTIEIYSYEENTWSIGNAMNYSHFGGCIAYHHGYIYMIGGLSFIDNIHVFTMVEKYNPHSNKWTVEKSLHFPRFNSSLCIIEDSIAIIGGYIINKYISQIEIYNEELDEWGIVGSIDIESFFQEMKK